MQFHHDHMLASRSVVSEKIAHCREAGSVSANAAASSATAGRARPRLGRRVGLHRECAARLRSLANLEAHLALREQLETVASDYDEIADEIEQKTKARR